jgi:hypothetical protein
MEAATLTKLIARFWRPLLNTSSDRYSEVDHHWMRRIYAMEWEGVGEFTVCLDSIGTSRSIRPQ